MQFIDVFTHKISHLIGDHHIPDWAMENKQNSYLNIASGILKSRIKEI